MLNFSAFLSYVFVANISPGPNTIISMSNASKFNLKKSIQFNLGVSLGAFFVLLICSFFSLTIFQVFPSIKLVMVWIGAGYILWLSWKILRSNPIANNEQSNENSSLFFHGLILQFVNPNTILYGVTAFTTFIIPQYNSPVMLITFSALLSLIAFICTICWTLFGSLFQKIIVKHGKIINVVMAVLLAYCAISLIIKK